MLPSELVARATADDLIGLAALMTLEHEEGEAERARIKAQTERPPEGSDEDVKRALAARAQARLRPQSAGRR